MIQGVKTSIQNKCEKKNENYERNYILLSRKVRYKALMYKLRHKDG